MTETEANKLKDAGVKIVTVGIGANINKDGLDSIASTPDLSFQSFDFVNLDKIKSLVAIEACDPYAHPFEPGE